VKKLILMLVALLIGAFSFQSFQCASKNLTTAKVAYTQKDYNKAIDYLNKEIQLNPNNAEAYAILADIYKEQGDYKLAAENAKKALELAKTEDLRKREESLIQTIWIECYNNGINLFNTYNGKNKEVLDDANKFFDIGLMVRPNILDFYKFKGMIAELKGDTLKSVEYYKAYVDGLKSSLQIAQEKGFFLGMPREKLLRAIGEKPINTITKKTEAFDTNFVDIFKINNKELYTFSNANDDGIKELVYWNYDPNPNLPNEEKMMQFSISLDPFSALAQYYYFNKNYDKAFEYIDQITKLNPNNQEALRSKLALYQEMGKTDVALNEAESLVKTDPNNESNWAQLGDLYQNLKRYDDAIKAYEKALEINPNYDIVLRNAGSAYKNKASVIQKEQQDRADREKAYKPNPEEYFPLLRKSAEYFTKALNTPKYNTDFIVMGELANIYMVTGQNAELNRITKTLEGINPLIENKDKERYYLILLNIYSFTKDTAKLREIEDKLNKLK